MSDWPETPAGPAAGDHGPDDQPVAARGVLILRDTGRVEAFSDGVFAVAATLLVLNLQPPDIGPGKQFPTLALALWGMAPKLVVYAISFSFILIMWINHHNMFRGIRGTDHTFLLLNGLLLLLITLVPFTTALIPAYGNLLDHNINQSVATAVYSLNYFLIALAYNFMWWYASGHRRLLHADVDMETVRSVNRRYRYGPFSYLACVALAFVSVPASLALNVALAVFFAWPHSSRTLPHTLQKDE